MFAQKDSQMTSSMYRDLDKGYRIERDQIIDDLITRGNQIGLTLPLLALVSTHLAVYESGLR
jgi:2-dehydropantoate 2-reductase